MTMRLKSILGTLAVVALASAATPAAASADLSLKRAEREAVRVVAPAQAESAFCFRPTIHTRGRRDQAFCVVSLVAPAGTDCTQLVHVKRRASLSGARISATKLNAPVCFPTPVPLSERDR
jgi:hypothetical protein